MVKSMPMLLCKVLYYIVFTLFYPFFKIYIKIFDIRDFISKNLCRSRTTAPSSSC